MIDGARQRVKLRCHSAGGAVSDPVCVVLADLQFYHVTVLTKVRRKLYRFANQLLDINQ